MSQSKRVFVLKDETPSEPEFDVREALRAVDGLAVAIGAHLEGAAELTRDDLIDLTVDFQERVKLFSDLASGTKAPLRADMEDSGESEHIAASGHKAKFFTSNRTNADKKIAAARAADPECGISSADISAIFKVKAVTSFKVS